MHEGGISIWFFNGVCLLVMGTLILGAGLYQLASPPAVEHRVVLYQLHAPIWWGALLLVLGVFYTIHFRPAAESKSK